MNEYVVWWEPDALDMLAAAWVEAPNRAAVTAAQAAADALLASDPTAFADHLCEGLWRLTVPPICVYFTTDAGIRRVVVTAVRLATR
jgi:hypothetical protein